VGKRIAKAVVENDLIKDNAINPEGEKRFLALYPLKVTNTIMVVGAYNTNMYLITDRDRHGMVMVMSGDITQSNVKIGTCTSTSGAANGTTYTTVSFYLANGTKCAEATFTGASSTNCTIITMERQYAPYTRRYQYGGEGK
jgi:hypothetical protein